MASLAPVFDATPKRSTASWRGHPTSQTRASSSPPSLDAMRCPRLRQAHKVLNPEVDPPEVYDMAAGDGDMARSPLTGTPPKRCTSLRFRRASAPGVCVKFSPQRQGVLIGASPGDAWSIDDWGCPASPARSRLDERLSLVEAVHSVDKAQRMIADVVRAELQVDLEMLVHRVVNQMGVQVQDNLRKSQDHAWKNWAMTDAETKSSVGKLSLQVEEMQNHFQEHRCAMAKMMEEEDIGLVAEERIAIFDQLQTSSPSLVLEKQQAAQWAQCRLRLDSIMAGIEKHLAVSVENQQIAEKVAEHDAGIQANAHALTKVELKLTTTCEKERLDFEMLGRQHSALVKHVAAHDTEFNESTALKGEMARLVDSVKCCDSHLDVLDKELRRTQADVTTEFQRSHDLLAEASGEDRVVELSKFVDVMQASIHAREDEMVRLVDNVKSCDSRMDGLNMELRRTQADVTREFQRSRDLLQEASGQNRVVELSKNVDALQFSIREQSKMLTQHDASIQQLCRDCCEAISMR